MGFVLLKAAPNKWLPFAADKDLYIWRNVLADQFFPGSYPKTVEVFATRQKMPPENYYKLLNSEKRMDEVIFTCIPRQRLAAFQTLLVSANLRLLSYWFSSPGHNS